jgi:hypothetical protein
MRLGWMRWRVWRFIRGCFRRDLGAGGKLEIHSPRSVEKHFQDGSAELQIPPLRFAPVGMTKGRVALPLGVG